MPVIPPQLPPMRAGLQRLGVYFTPGAAALLISAVVLYSSHTDKATLPARAEAMAAAQAWTTDSVPSLIAHAVAGTLPDPDPRQRKPPCDPDLEREVGGYCWIALKVPPPCPRGKAWEHEGVCFGYALKPMRTPASGPSANGDLP